MDITGYCLAEDEVILFQGEGLLNETRQSAKVLLTNHVIVTEYNQRLGFRKYQTITTTYNLEDIKVYEGKPQAIVKGTCVNIYFKNQELKIEFDSWKNPKKIQTEIFNVITGEKMVDRGAGKVKRAIGVVNDTVGINVFETAAGIFENGLIGSAVGLFAGKKKKSKTGHLLEAASTISSAVAHNSANTNKDDKAVEDSKTATAIKNQNETEESQIMNNNALSHDEQIRLIKEYKDLLDSQIITEEEFEIKKKEILNI